MTRLIVIRHGYSSANKNKIYSGHMDVPLEEIGIAQAERTAEYVLKNYKVDAIYSSDLSRACNTVRPIADALGLPLNKCAELREIDVGKWQGMLFDDVKTKMADNYNSYKIDPWNVPIDGGESYSMVIARALPKIEEIARDNDGKTVVIASHGGAIRALLSVWLDMKDRIWDVPLSGNCSVTVVEYDGGRFEVVSVGYTAHLDD
ncbi:MAG: histidine phosphatase family protein [Clostridia bacterium]|nr:histidine phosphatase family protein [Clostridia bacterium]